MSEFSDRPFAVGTLLGIRSFRVTDAGVLTGVHQQIPWHDGINEAACHRPMDGLQALSAAFSASAAVSMAQFSWSMEQLSAQMTGRVLMKKRPKTPPPKPAVPRPEHDTGTLGCTCGFYAYFDNGNNPHHLADNMLAIVEGFGITTVGSRGFRSSKARIRALIVENFEQGFALAKVRPNYPGVPVFGSIEHALGEYPLSPKPEGVSEPPVIASNSVTFTFTVRDNTSSALRRLVEQMRIPTRAYTFGFDRSRPDETPRDRALRLRRERNTGPADTRGLDGHRHRRSARP